MNINLSKDYSGASNDGNACYMPSVVRYLVQYDFCSTVVNWTTTFPWKFENLEIDLICAHRKIENVSDVKISISM